MIRDDDEFRYSHFQKTRFWQKNSKKISYRNRTLKTCQIFKQNVFNVSDSELKTFQRVSFWTKVTTQQGVAFQIKFFWLCHGLNFDFITKQSVFAKQIWNKKIWIFFPLYERQFLHSACIPKMHYWDWKFSEISFWVETSNVSDSEFNVFQSVKFESTFSNLPRILDWVFYNMPDIELNFLWGRNNLGKIIGLKSITFWFILSRKKTTILPFCLHFQNARLWPKISIFSQVLKWNNHSVSDSVSKF